MKINSFLQQSTFLLQMYFKSRANSDLAGYVNAAMMELN